MAALTSSMMVTEEASPPPAVLAFAGSQGGTAEAGVASGEAQPPAGGPQRQWSAADLAARAQSALDMCEPELAVRFLRRAAELEPSHLAVLDLLAETEMSLGESERAGLAWRCAIQASGEPHDDKNAERWLYLAQLQEGNEARESNGRGVALLTARLQRTASVAGEHSPETVTLHAQLCTAFCALAELYLTDLCFEDDAERACQAALDEAMRHNSTDSHEPIQGLASLRLSQGNHEEAAQLMQVAFQRIQQSEQAVDSDLRLASARLLLECAPHAPSCADAALELLAQMMREDDGNVETWFLMGVAFFQQTPPDLPLARQYLEKAATMLETVRRSMADEGACIEGDFPYEAQLRLVMEQLELVTQAEHEHGEGTAEDEELVDANEATFEMED